jgi:non-ribosomal peptide synthetase component E (peptide arylation enzyme)
LKKALFKFKNKTYCDLGAVRCASEAGMEQTAAQREASRILADLPDRISDVIKPFARQTPDHLAPVQGDVTWTYGVLAAIVADTAVLLQLYDIRPGDRVMIVGENCLALAALIFATSEIDAWSVVVNPRLSDREIDLIRAHSATRPTKPTASCRYRTSSVIRPP